MSKVMDPTPLSALLERMAGEYRAKRSIYEIPEAVFREAFALEEESPGMAVMGGRASLPVGPAAGPHSQIAPNLVAAYLAGSRVFELKTVQENDALDIEKPCILALDEGHNVEWSTELTLDAARGEYLRGWIAVNLLAALWSPKPRDFFFNMSVGYTLAGIKGAKVDAYIEGMRAPAKTAFWDRAMGELKAFVEGPSFAAAFGAEALSKARALLADFPSSPVHSVTLSTMHGCPPDEIGRIGRYLIEEKGFDAYVKLNPTLIGYDEARRILDATGWTDIGLKREGFEHDLQWKDALGLVKDLGAAAAAKGRRFGVKLSNTLANANDGGFLPGAERYMSGRALFPITIRLAARLSEALPDFPRRFSYCGGVSALNARDLAAAGLGPLTVATDILKPGGYLRLLPMAREAVAALEAAGPSAAGEGRPDLRAVARLADAALERPEYRKEWKSGNAFIAKPLPLFDCFAAPCVEACPVNQKVPEYLRLGAAGDAMGAFATILADNPLPCVTGTLCDHVCQAACSRNDYEGPVEIRAAKLACAKAASIPAARPAPADFKGKVAVVGAGPAGLACAHHLALAGVPVVVFDEAKGPGGVPANVIPRFRIPREDITRDIDRIKALGAEFRFGTRVADRAALEAQGFTAVFLAAGAPAARELKLAGSGVRVVDALAFLEACSEGGAAFADCSRIVVAGGGNTAMDAVRAATRLPGAKAVRLSYRRTLAEMPADREELENALHEGKTLNAATAGGAPVLHELSLPEGAAPGRLTLRAMKLGEKDASGRRSPVPSDETFELDCDLLVAAVGETPDRALLERFGLAVGKDGRPAHSADTQATALPGLYVGGDAARGPSSIIAAEADGRRAAYAILKAAGIEPPADGYAPPEPRRERLDARGELLAPMAPADAGFLAREAKRCLECDSACLRCVEVCPNRANMAIPRDGAAEAAGLSQAFQILHVDYLCNECGNCGLFCPYEGEPFRGKATLFPSRAALEASHNAGFALVEAVSGGAVLAVRDRADAPARELSREAFAAAAAAGEPMPALAALVERSHPYLLGGKR
ncbi:MAG: putative selenate reductase subunit YgfK [Spirochaetaceae bacterium]|nr:putative selenate reductase subunit YgfK [Spirochaetaceae bacterium]